MHGIRQMLRVRPRAAGDQRHDHREDRHRCRPDRGQQPPAIGQTVPHRRGRRSETTILARSFFNDLPDQVAEPAVSCLGPRRRGLVVRAAGRGQCPALSGHVPPWRRSRRPLPRAWARCPRTPVRGDRALAAAGVEVTEWRPASGPRRRRTPGRASDVSPPGSVRPRHITRCLVGDEHRVPCQAPGEVVGARRHLRSADPAH